MVTDSLIVIWFEVDEYDLKNCVLVQSVLNFYTFTYKGSNYYEFSIIYNNKLNVFLHKTGNRAKAKISFRYETQNP